MQNLSAADVRDALGEMGEILFRAGKTGDIALYGGSAILLQFEATFRTADVDAVVESGDHGAIMQAAREIAERRGWLRSWFSEAVASYLGGLPATEFHASYPSETRVGLRVYVAQPDYLLAMKLRALRAGTRDEADAATLARACGLATNDELFGLVQKYFPKEALDARRRAIIGRFVRTLSDAPDPDDPG